MTLLDFKNPCRGDDRIEFDGKKGYDSWLDLALESSESMRFAVEGLNEEFGLETTKQSIVKGNIDEALNTASN